MTLREVLVAALLFLVALGAYLDTASPTVATADSGELVACAHSLGIAHPTGYPGYSQVAKGLQLTIPLGSIAWRTGLLGALSSALGVALLWPLFRQSAGGVGAAAGLLALAFSRTLWGQGTVQEVYPFLFLLEVLLLRWACSLRLERDPRWLGAGALLAGLAVTHHLLAGLLLPGLLWLSVVGRSPRLSRKQVAPILLALLLGLVAPLLYLPIRTTIQGIPHWGDLTRPAPLLRHVTGRQFHGIMFHKTPELLARSGRHLLGLLGREIPPLIHPAALLGWWLLLRRNRRLALGLLALALPVVVFGINYSIVDIEAYFIPLYMVWCWAAAVGLGGLLRALRRTRLVRVGAVVVLSLGASSWIWSWQAVDHSRNWIGYDYAMDVLSQAQVKGNLMTQGWSTPFLFHYLQHVLHLRPDLVIHLDAQGTLLRRLLQEGPSRIDTTIPLRPPDQPELPLVAEGLLYRVGRSSPRTEGSPVLWERIRSRGLEQDSLSRSYHDRALQAKILYLRGEARFQEGDHPEARRLYRAARAAAPANHFVLNNLGCLLMEKGWLAEAAEACRAALELDPGFALARHNLAGILLRQGQEEEARREFERAAGSRAGIFSLANLGELELRQGRYQEARKHLEKAIRWQPRSAEARTNLGVALLHDGEPELAGRHLREAVRIDPRLPQARINLGGFLASQGLPQEARVEFEAALEMQPNQGDALIGLGILAGEAGRMEEAVELLSRALAADATSVAARNNLALALSRLGRTAEAVRLWQESLEINPDQPHVAVNIYNFRVFDGSLDSRTTTPQK